jgi:hypothetical protein
MESPMSSQEPFLPGQECSGSPGVHSFLSLLQSQSQISETPQPGSVCSLNFGQLNLSILSLGCVHPTYTYIYKDTYFLPASTLFLISMY